MKIKYDFSELARVADKFNSESVDFEINLTVFEFEPLDIQLSEGLEIDLSDIKIDAGLLSYQGRQVLLYIKDHSYSNGASSSKFDAAVENPESGNRFHVSDCSTIKKMRSMNRFERYVATNNVSGYFEIEASSNYGPNRTAKVALKVCKNCLSNLNYKGYSSEGVRGKVFSEFSLDEFFSEYSSCFSYMPKAWGETFKVGYVSNWQEISKATREREGYTCSHCKINLSSNKNLCHVHHINGVKNDNNASNLKVLCIDCHRRQPYHEGMYVKHSDMQVITALRHKVGIFKNNSWGAVLNYADPALLGDLLILKRKGEYPPHIGYSIENNLGETVIFDVAWPQKKTALLIDPIEVPGWKILKRGSYCG